MTSTIKLKKEKLIYKTVNYICPSRQVKVNLLLF